MSDEFASAAMMRVLTQGLKELSPPPLPKLSHVGRNQATVDLDLKLRWSSAHSSMVESIASPSGLWVNRPGFKGGPLG